jgi:hypothetical protein
LFCEAGADAIGVFQQRGRILFWSPGTVKRSKAPASLACLIPFGASRQNSIYMKPGRPLAAETQSATLAATRTHGRYGGF